MFGQVELCILAEHFQAEVAVTDVQTGRADVFGQGRGHAWRVYMIFTGIHFDAIGFDQGLRRVPTSSPLSVAAADAAVVALAARQRSAGQFTDQATMRLRCEEEKYASKGTAFSRVFFDKHK